MVLCTTRTLSFTAFKIKISLGKWVALKKEYKCNICINIFATGKEVSSTMLLLRKSFPFLISTNMAPLRSVTTRVHFTYLRSKGILYTKMHFYVFRRIISFCPNVLSVQYLLSKLTLLSIRQYLYLLIYTTFVFQTKYCM